MNWGVCLAIAVALVGGCSDAGSQSGAPTAIATAGSAHPRADERERLVASIAASGLRQEKVLDALRKVPRHMFVPKALAGSAYADRPLPIGKGQTISQPYIVAYMTEQLAVEANHRVLEIGTGSGYQAAVLAELVAEVYSIEIVAPLSAGAAEVLDELGYRNVHLRVGDGYAGWPEHAPFDRIVLTAAPAEVPQPLIDQLAAGGRLVAPLTDRATGHQFIWRYDKRADGTVNKQRMLAVRFVPMTGRAQERAH